MNTTMNTAFETLSVDQLAIVAGGFDWNEVASSGNKGAVLGAVTGGVGGAIVSGGPGVLPGAAGGAVVGYVGGAAENIGKQLGWWK
jgi:hypothetical protein